MQNGFEVKARFTIPKPEGEKIGNSVIKSWKTGQIITAAALLLTIGLGPRCTRQNIKYDRQFSESPEKNIEETDGFSRKDAKYYQSVFARPQEVNLEKRVSFSAKVRERLGETYEYPLENGNMISVTYGLDPLFTIISKDRELIYFSKRENLEFLSVYGLENKRMLDISLSVEGDLEVQNGSQTIKYDSTLNKYLRVLRSKFGMQFMEVNQSKGREFMEFIMENEYKKYRQILKVDDVMTIYQEAYDNTFNLR